MKDKYSKLKNILNKSKVMTKDMPEELKKEAKKMYGDDISAEMMGKVRDEYADEYEKKKPARKKPSRKPASNMLDGIGKESNPLKGDKVESLSDAKDARLRFKDNMFNKLKKKIKKN